MYQNKRNETIVRATEQAALVDLAKSTYASFRSTEISFLFDYLRSIEGYRDDVQ